MSKSFIVPKKQDIRLVWALLCNDAVTDQETNNLTLYNLIEQFQISKTALLKQDKKIILPVAVKLVSLWSRINTTGKNEFSAQIEIDLVDPAGDVLQVIPHELRVLEGKDRIRLIIKLQGLPVSKEGAYLFRFKVKRGTAFEVVGGAEFNFQVK